MATIKEAFEKAVAEGKVDWKKADWTAIGCPADKNSKVFLAEYPRWKQNGNGSDCAYVTVNGVNVTLHGTSNQNAEEYARYQTKGSGTPRGPRSAAVTEQQSANKDMLLQYLGTKQTWSSQELDMLLKMACCKDMLIQYIQTKDTWNLNELLLLVQM